MVFINVNTLLGKPQSMAEKGYLDLSGYDFNDNEVVLLNGEWEFYAGKLLTPDDFLQNHHEPEYIKTPGPAPMSDILGQGVGTYRLVFETAPDLPTLALAVNEIASSYDMWLDGENIFFVGTVHNNPYNCEPYIDPSMIQLGILDGGNHELLINIANFSYFQGGILDNIFLGENNRIFFLTERARALQIIIIVILLCAAFIPLVFRTASQDVGASLLLAIFSALCAINISVSYNKSLYLLFQIIELDIIVKLQACTLLAMLYTASLLINKNTDLLKLSNKKIMFAVLSLCLFIAATPIQAASFILLIVYVFALLVIILNIIKLSYQAIEKKYESLYLLISLSVLFVTCISGIYEKTHVVFARNTSLFGILIVTAALLYPTLKGILTGASEPSEKKWWDEKEQIVYKLAAQNRLFAQMNHEIRTPISGIIGMINLFDHSSTAFTPDEREYIETIKECSKQLMQVLNEFLDYTKIEADKIEIAWEVFDIYEIEKYIKNMYGSTLKAKGIEFKTDFKNLPRNLVGDKFRIRQILLNIINNSVKFTEYGRIEVTVFLKSKPRDEHLQSLNSSVELQFEISDTGKGISDEKKMQIFNPFIQAQSPSEINTGGTGLGLYICKKLITAMGGKIDFESNEGVGTIFRFTLNLPLDVSDDNSAAPDAKDSTPIFEALVVDDTEFNRKIISRQLAILGIKATLCDSGKEAIKKICPDDKKSRFSIILLDCKMPEQDGFETTKEIRARGCNIPIIAVTALVSAEQRECCIASGMNDFLAKPFLPKQLSDVIYKNINIASNNGIDFKSHTEISPEPMKALSFPKFVDEAGQKRFQKTFGDDRTFLLELLSDFIKDMQSKLEFLREALILCNNRDAEIYAHAMKSSGFYIGAMRFSDIAERLEQQARDGMLESQAMELFKLFDALQKEFWVIKQETEVFYGKA